MSISNFSDLSLDQLRSATKDKPVVLLFPWCSYRNAFLAHFLRTAHSGLMYFRPMDTNLTLSKWLSSLAAHFDRTLDGFTSNLKSVLDTDNPIQMAEAFASDLSKYSAGQPIIVFIDEFDRVIVNGDMRSFLDTLVTNLTPGIQLVFNSRSLQLDTWSEMLTRGDVCVLGTENRSSDVIFTIEDQSRPQLEVYAFGQGHVFVNGQEITQWDGALPRNLFFYLMDHPLITRDEIFDVFWPNLSVKEATNVFHVTKRKISERIGAKVADGKSYELTQYKSGFYTPSDKITRHYDVREFQDALNQVMFETTDEQEKVLLGRAISLYRHEFLTTVSMDWSVERRDQLRHLYAQALISMARLHQRNHEWQAALGYFVRALKQIPEREDIHREVMNIYRQQGMYEDAARQYHALAKIVNETLHIAPDYETQALFEKIQSHL